MLIYFILVKWNYRNEEIEMTERVTLVFFIFILHRFYNGGVTFER